jgi:hypothetical protein
VTAGAEEPGLRRRWWIAVLFVVGSTLFALGAVPAYSEAVGLDATAVTFFTGSLFFTSAAFFQYREAVDGLGASNRNRHFWVWAPRDADWAACGVQLLGTLWFNWSTGNAVRHNLTASLAHDRVWRPDALGSIAFLVASGVAWASASREQQPGGGRSRDWWIAGINLLGSVAFGVSAVAGYIIPSSGNVWHAELSNLGTFAGALCFLAGAVLLLPQDRTKLVPAPPTS